MGTKVLPKKIHRWSTAPEYCQMQNHEASTGHNLVLKRLFNNFPFFAKGIHAFCFFYVRQCGTQFQLSNVPNDRANGKNKYTGIQQGVFTL